jgi:hypothetical protein
MPMPQAPVDAAQADVGPFGRGTRMEKWTIPVAQSKGRHPLGGENEGGLSGVYCEALGNGVCSFTA